MDVTYGLLSNLVKTKSILRVLAPIASQISLLIILNESEDDDLDQPSDMVPCSQAVMQATNRLCIVAKQQAQSSTDMEFVAQTMSSCEVLDLASSNLYIAAERLEISRTSKEVKEKLIQACKDVLQGTMKVLLVADDAEIRRLITTTHIVTEKLSLVQDVKTMPDLVTQFKEFTDALAVLTGLADKRQRDLIHAKQRERILSSLTVLKQCVSSLNMAMQNSIKYSSNTQAQMARSYVVTEILDAVRDIVEAVQNTNTDEQSMDDDSPGNFVTRIDQALEALGVQKRDDLHIDLEMWTEEVVRHSMMVAHVCRDNHRDIIIKTCQRVIQVKSRVVQMSKSDGLLQDEILPQFREDYDDVCELLVDELCELEKNVNIALLHLVIEYFKETTEPLQRLVKAAVYTDGGRALEPSDRCIKEFEEHTEKMCQIAVLAAASSSDAKRVNAIRAHVHRLENLDPELTTAVVCLSQATQDHGAVKTVKLLMREWTTELTGLVKVLDEMTDPKMFMLVSERKVEDDINTCNGCMLIGEHEVFVQVVQSVIGRSSRVAQVAERIIDTSTDAVYRNGYRVFLQQLKKAITAVRSASSSVQGEFGNKNLQDTMRRRFSFLQDSLMRVKLGLSSSNHPHILSPLRRNLRDTPRTNTFAEPSLKTVSSRQESPRSVRWGQNPGHQYVATSVPRLQLDRGTEEGIQPQSVHTLHTELKKSASISGPLPVDSQTHAWKLMRELLSWATKGDKGRANTLCGDLLGWTNHIVDLANMVLTHCKDKEQKKEMDGLSYDVDGMVSNLLDKIKYVLHGDFSDLAGVKQLAENWAYKVEKLRVYVDITVEKWKGVCDKVRDATKAQKLELVKHELEMVESHQKAVADLIGIVETVRWEGKVKGHQQCIEQLLDTRNDLDNVTVTLKTTAELITDQGLKDDLIQLEQLGREWSVHMYTASATIETVGAGLLGLDKGSQLWPCLGTDEGLVEELEEETAQLKDLVKCACFGLEDKKELYKGLVMDMRDCVQEMRTTSIKKRISVKEGGGAGGVVSGKYSRHRLNLQKGIWVLKAVQCIDLTRQQASHYGRYVDMLIDKVFQIRACTGEERQSKLQEYHADLDQFTVSVKSVRQKVLNCIQLSAELDKRSVVRQALDNINAGIPEVVKVLTSLAESADSGCFGAVTWCRLRWCVRVRHLIIALEHITDIKTSAVTGIKHILVPEVDCPEYVDLHLRDHLDSTPDHVLSQIVPSVHASNSTMPSPGAPTSSASHSLLKPGTPGNTGQTSFSTSKLGTTNSSLRSLSKFGKTFQGEQWHIMDADEDNFVNFEPVVVSLKATEGQIIDNTRRHDEKLSASFTQAAKSDASTRHGPKAASTSALTDTANPVAALMREAQYIERQVYQWEDEANPIVRVAKTMAKQILHMTQFIRYQGPITSHLELVQTAKAVADNSEKIVKFAHILSTLCVDDEFGKNLQSYCSQIPTIKKQLTILSNVQLGTAQSETADRMLVQNAQNLMKKIMDTITACEALCVKGLKADVPPEAKHAVLLARQWRQRNLEHRNQCLTEDRLDELGLRVVEDDAPPPALTHMFKT